MAATLHTRWDSERDLEDKRQQFVSAASHDLKTPLALIGGYAEAIAQDISPEENARYLAAIEQETARMNGLVREMLDYTRLDRTDELKNRKTLNLTALVNDMLTEYAPLFEKRRLTVDIADGVRIRGDETRLSAGECRQVFAGKRARVRSADEQPQSPADRRERLRTHSGDRAAAPVRDVLSRR